MTTAQDIFEIKCLLTNIKIKLCCRIESGVKQLIALITSDGEVVLHYTYGELPSVVKRVPWFTESTKAIQAICFDPTATWLLVVSLDGSLYIIPALSLLDRKQKIDCKWSLNDLTHFGRHGQTPGAIPTSIVWWQTSDCNQNALVGYETGALALISLTDGRCLGTCSITEPITRLCVCQDNKFDGVCLLIFADTGHPWVLTLEQSSIGYLWPPESNCQAEPRSKLSNLKQMGVEKLASLKQKLTEARARRNSQTSESTSEGSDAISSVPEIMPYMSETLVEAQYVKNQFLLSAFFKDTSIFTMFLADLEPFPLYTYKLLDNTSYPLLTNKLIYCINNDYNLLSIISTQLSDCRSEGDSEFNSESLIAQFPLRNERILKIFKLTDLSLMLSRKSKDSNKDKLYEFPKSVDDLKLKSPRIDTCVIITDNSVYNIVVKKSPIHKFVELITKENNYGRAEKLAAVFGLNMQQLLEGCGDLMIAKGAFHSGIILYKQAKVHILKRVLKLAISSDCKTLLKFVHLCLSASKVDMALATKIHIGNLAVMAYTELILRHNGTVRTSNTRDFMNFLRFEEYYDQVLAVNVACQAGHWNIVTLLAKARGLQSEVVAAFGQILQSARAPKPCDRDFLFCLSEPCLSQFLIIFPQSQQIFNYIRTNIDSFPVDILRRFAAQLDPSKPTVVSVVRKLIHRRKSSTSFDTTIESVDLDYPDKTTVTVKDLIETFLYVLVYLVAKTDKSGFDLKLLDKIELCQDIFNIDPPRMKTLPKVVPLNCGYEHAAVVRNSSLYTIGVNNSGCLGLGPLLTESSPLKPVTTLSDLKVKVISVNCGRKHTLVSTDYGVFSFGSNSHGQLGLGPLIQETPYPQMMTTLSSQKIVEIAAGQYHSVALTACGRVYSWGWGIHGQLGHGDCTNCYYPKLLKFDEEIAQVTAGHAHSLILTVSGKLYGFGSNVFGQLECSDIKTKKATRPVWVQILPGAEVPLVRIATTYFHNVALRSDNLVFVWGASPQEVRFLQSSKAVQKNNGVAAVKGTDVWKEHIVVYSDFQNTNSIEDISIGYRHTAILHDGHIHWGKNKDPEMHQPKLIDEISMVYTKKFLHICCGLDFTMALDKNGKLWAWGSPSIAQTLLRKPLDDDKKTDGRVLIFRNTKRVVRAAPTINAAQGNENMPMEVPGLPTMAITFESNDLKLLFNKYFVPYSILKVENNEKVHRPPSNRPQSKHAIFNYIQKIPDFKYSQKTLHFVIEKFFGFFDTETILSICLETNNHQAASKIAILDGHFGDSLAFQLVAFKKYMDSFDLNLESLKDDIKEKQHEFVARHCDDLNDVTEKSNISSSSSLDSIRQWGDDVEHQGGCESPCEASSELGDVKQNITHYVQSLKNCEQSPISSVSKILSNEKRKKNDDDVHIGVDVKDETTKDVIDNAAKLIEFYIRKVYISENHILMQNVLMKCIEFWLTSNLPVAILENILLKNMDKYFYPLSILLFCKNFNSSLDEEIIKKCDETKRNCPGFLKEFSTKFCLQLCSMVLENVNKA